MARKKKDSQGPIIDEVRKVRKAVWNEFKANPKHFLDETRKLAKSLGMRYGTPPKRKKDEDAA